MPAWRYCRYSGPRARISATRVGAPCFRCRSIQKRKSQIQKLRTLVKPPNQISGIRDSNVKNSRASLAGMSALKQGLGGTQAVFTRVNINPRKCVHSIARPHTGGEHNPLRPVSTWRTSAAQLPGLATSEEWEDIAKDVSIQPTTPASPLVVPGKTSGALEAFQRCNTSFPTGQGYQKPANASD